MSSRGGLRSLTILQIPGYSLKHRVFGYDLISAKLQLKLAVVCEK